MSQNVVKKSYRTEDPLISYCSKITVKSEPIEQELTRETLAKAQHAGMLGAPEVLQMGKNFIKLAKGRKVLDVGTFTGASALAWALALPEDGLVISMDVSHEELDRVGRPLIATRPEVLKRIDFRKGSALDTLDDLIAKGESGTFDFAFIDADKVNYTNYYKKCMELLRPGGIILVDNALWGGSVCSADDKSPSTVAIDACNRYISEDPNSLNMLLNVGDGAHVAFKN